MKLTTGKIIAIIAGSAVALALFILAGLWQYPAVRLPVDGENNLAAAQSEETVGNSELMQFQYTAPWSSDSYDSYYRQKKDVPDIGRVYGGIVPHHLVAGYIPATFFDNLKKYNPPAVVLFGPNHFNAGNFDAISTLRDWKSPYGITKTDTDIIRVLLQKGLLAVDEGVIKEEHSVYSIIPFIKASLPEAKVVPIVFKFKTPTSTVDKLLADLLPALPEGAVILSSIDFSHYQTLPAADFHDELSEGVISNFDFDRSQKLEIDSPPSLYAIMKSMEKLGTQKIGFSLHNNSADILNASDLKETTSYFSPYFVKGGAEPQKISSLLFFGDMMLDRNVKKAIDKNGQDYLFSQLAGQENRFFMGMDAIHANLEGPFADVRRATSKSIAFRFDPVLLPMLKKYNFSIFTAANNHTYDMGAAGFKESDENLRTAGFDVYGSQYSVDDGSLFIKKIGDYNFAFVGLNDTNSPVDGEKVIALIKKAKNANVIPNEGEARAEESLNNNQSADFVIVNIHWGEEYKEISNTRQRALAHAFIDAGADVIIGHHPHVVQEMEIYKNRPIFYSLGNFIFDQYFSLPTQQGLAIGFVFKDKSISAYVFPLQGDKSQVSQMPYSQAGPYLSSWISNSRLDNYHGKFANSHLLINL